VSARETTGPTSQVNERREASVVNRKEHEENVNPVDPEREVAQRNAGERSAPESPGEEAFGGEERFTAEDSEGERGYRGTEGEDTPPGSVPGGSYGAGGGVQQGGFDGGSDEGTEPAGKERSS
jgi:hypothetical protein